jgi:pyrimidine-specific ribonucleoside hydrolase
MPVPCAPMRDDTESLQNLPQPEPLHGTPLIIDTDIGGDADDAVALAVAARHVPDLALVITTDERGGDRARFARHFLDHLGRPDMPVVAGADLGYTRYFCVDGLFPTGTPRQPDDVVTAVAGVAGRTGGPVRWVGMGPLSNLATVLEHRPDLSERLVVTQMGGAFDYRKPGEAEHNFRLDPEAVRQVLDAAPEPTLVLSDTTFTDDLEISARTPIYQRLAAPDAPSWAAILKAHLDRWFAHTYPSTIQHDGLTLSAALGHPFVDFNSERVRIDDIGRMTRDPSGIRVHASQRARYPAFMSWLGECLRFAGVSSAVGGGPPGGGAPR